MFFMKAIFTALIIFHYFILINNYLRQLVFDAFLLYIMIFKVPIHKFVY